MSGAVVLHTQSLTRLKFTPKIECRILQTTTQDVKMTDQLSRVEKAGRAIRIAEARVQTILAERPVSKEYKERAFVLMSTAMEAVNDLLESTQSEDFKAFVRRLTRLEINLVSAVANAQQSQSSTSSSSLLSASEASKLKPLIHDGKNLSFNPF